MMIELVPWTGQTFDNNTPIKGTIERVKVNDRRYRNQFGKIGRPRDMPRKAYFSLPRGRRIRLRMSVEVDPCSSYVMCQHGFVYCDICTRLFVSQ